MNPLFNEVRSATESKSYLKTKEVLEKYECPLSEAEDVLNYVKDKLSYVPVHLWHSNQFKERAVNSASDQFVKKPLIGYTSIGGHLLRTYCSEVSAEIVLDRGTLPFRSFAVSFIGEIANLVQDRKGFSRELANDLYTLKIECDFCLNYQQQLLDKKLKGDSDGLSALQGRINDHLNEAHLIWHSSVSNLNNEQLDTAFEVFYYRDVSRALDEAAYLLSSVATGHTYNDVMLILEKNIVSKGNNYNKGCL